MTQRVDWEEIKALSGDNLKSTIFNLLCEVSREIQNLSEGEEFSTDIVPRLLELRNERAEIRELDEAIAELARAAGLWNYLDELDADIRVKIIAEAARSKELSNLILHREQWRALSSLLSRKNVILSAPTSFGKSLLIDAILAADIHSTVVIVVPTIALLDETRRRLTRKFGSEYQIISDHSEAVTVKKRVFIGTQERLIAREDVGHIDLLVVDEFYKLDPSRTDTRSAALNAAVYRLLKRAGQFFFLGPNIDTLRLDPDAPWKFEFIKTKFATVAVDTLDLSGVKDRDASLVQQVSNEAAWPTLVFASSPDRANAIAHRLIEDDARYGSGAKALARWMRENYWVDWPLCSSVEAGVSVHHGRIPRALASRIVHEFDIGNVNVLACTSTLIEGVNTSARSVVIYDKKISRDDYDFFTFANIRGRAGRLGKHYVAKVVLYHQPPEQEEFEVDTPLFHDLDDAPDDLVVHFEPDEMSDDQSTRMSELSDRTGLPIDTLKRFPSIPIDTIEALKDEVERRLQKGTLPYWSGYPNYNDIKSVNGIICKVEQVRKFGAVSDSQLTFYLHRLRTAKSMSDFFRWVGNNNNEPAEFDQIFKFLRSCEFGIGEYYTLIQELINFMTDRRVDFSLFVAEMRTLFRPEPLKILDERGVPIQISERFYSDGDTVEVISRRLLEATTTLKSQMTSYERKWIRDSLGG